MGLFLVGEVGERVATLIMIDTYAGWKGSLSAAEVEARVEHTRRMLSAPPEHFEPPFQGLFAAEPPTAYLSLLADVAAAFRPRTLRRQLDIMARTDLSPVLPQISVPTLLIWGRQDARSPLDIARQFDEAISDTTLVIIDDAGHLSPLEQPTQVNTAIGDFCRIH